MSIVLNGSDGDLISRASLLTEWNNMNVEEREHFEKSIMNAPTACRPDIMKLELREAAGHSMHVLEKDAHIILDKRGIVIENKEILDKLLGKDSSIYASTRMHTEVQR